MNIGWLGLGAMGTPMARRLAQAGHHVRAYDPTPGRADQAAGVVPVDHPADAGSECDALVVMVASPAQAESAMFGADGAAATLQPGNSVLLLSTLGPAWVKALGARLPAQVRVIDAPVSGGVTRAGEGTLLIMAAGANDSDRALLGLLGEVVVVGDEPGQGQAMKMVNQVLCGIHIAAAAEALALAESMGIDPELAWTTVRRGAAASFMLDDRGARMLRGADGQVRSAISLFVKDLHLVLDEASESGLPTPVAAAAARLFADAGAAGMSAHDDAELFAYVRSRWSAPPSSSK